MPISFYVDLDPRPGANDEGLCLNAIEMFDGAAVCQRAKGHRVDVMEGRNIETGEFHQEALEGWVWDSNGSVS